MNIKKAIEQIRVLDKSLFYNFILSLDMAESATSGSEDIKYTYEVVLESLGEEEFIELYKEKWNKLGKKIFSAAYQLQKYEVAQFIAKNYTTQMENNKSLAYDIYDFVQVGSLYSRNSSICYKKLNNHNIVFTFWDNILHLIKDNIKDTKIIPEFEKLIVSSKLQHCIMFADLEGFKFLEKTVSLNAMNNSNFSIHSHVGKYNNATDRRLFNYLQENGYISHKDYESVNNMLIDFMRFIFRNLSLNEIHLKTEVDIANRDFLKKDIVQHNIAQLMYQDGYHIALERELYPILSNNYIEETLKEFFKYSKSIIAKTDNNFISFNEEEIKVLVLLESQRNKYQSEKIKRDNSYYNSVDMSAVDKDKIIKVFKDSTGDNSVEAEKFLLNLSLREKIIDRKQVLKI